MASGLTLSRRTIGGQYVRTAESKGAAIPRFDWERQIAVAQRCGRYPVLQALPGPCGNFELDGLLRLLLHHAGSRCHMASMAEIVDAQSDQVAPTQFAVDGQVEECQVSDPAENFQANANCPDFAYAKRCFLPHQLPLVPRRTVARGTFH